MSWQQILINIAITLAAALLTALGSWVLVKVKNLVATKIKNTKTQALLLGAVDVVASVVKATYQTYVQAIKGTEAWTQEAQKNASCFFYSTVTDFARFLGLSTSNPFSFEI